MVIRPEKPMDAQNITDLHDEAFGPGRFARTVYRVREAAATVQDLSLVAIDGPRLVGSIRFSAIRIGGKTGALLLGPLAVFKDYSGHRCGLRLMSEGLDQAAQLGFELALLVGDVAYYQKAGFEQIGAAPINMPGPVDQQRLLVVQLQSGALARFEGVVGA